MKNIFLITFLFSTISLFAQKEFQLGIRAARNKIQVTSTTDIVIPKSEKRGNSDNVEGLGWSLHITTQYHFTKLLSIQYESGYTERTFSNYGFIDINGNWLATPRIQHLSNILMLNVSPIQRLAIGIGGEFGVRHWRDSNDSIFFPRDTPNGIYGALALGGKVTITEKLKMDVRWLLGFPYHKENYYTIDLGRVSPRTPLYSDRSRSFELGLSYYFFNPTPNQTLK